jgi:hypothetical protein
VQPFGMSYEIRYKRLDSQIYEEIIHRFLRADRPGPPTQFVAPRYYGDYNAWRPCVARTLKRITCQYSPPDRSTPTRSLCREPCARGMDSDE